MIDLVVNGVGYRLAVAPDTPLLWVLREELGLTGTKYGCDDGRCGACTVLVDGRAVRACAVEGGNLDGPVITIEGARDAADRAVADLARRLETAWLEGQVGQCGYCQPGMIMAALGLLLHRPRPSGADIAEAIDNLCRCGSYDRIRDAIRTAAARTEETTP